MAKPIKKPVAVKPPVKVVKKVAKKEYVNIYTPIGILSYPYLVKPDTGRTNSSNKFSAEIYVPKAVMQTEGKECIAAVLKVGREYFKDPSLKLADFKGPFTDMDTKRDAEDWQKGTIRIRAKANPAQRPTCIGAKKNPETDKFDQLSEEEVSAIKGGDYGRLICGVYGYPQQGGGVALGLNFFQFAKEGKALGQGKMKQLEAISEIEVEVDSPEDMVDEEPTEEAEEEETDPDMTFA